MRHIQDADAFQSLAHEFFPPAPARHLYMVWFMVPGA
jgi:hypothetical protein